jgi:ATP synthase protein I
MNRKTKSEDNRREEFDRSISKKEARKIKARKNKESSIWYGLGMFGIVGWSISIPTLIGIALGIWIDSRWPGRFSWTLMLLIAGVAIGCINAWYWVSKEREEIERQNKWKNDQDD